MLELAGILDKLESGILCRSVWLCGSRSIGLRLGLGLNAADYLVDDALNCICNLLEEAADCAADACRFGLLGCRSSGSNSRKRSLAESKHKYYGKNSF